MKEKKELLNDKYCTYFNEARFRFGWKLLCKVWRDRRGCLEFGCSRDTLAFCVYETWGKSNFMFYKNFYRVVLMEAVNRGWVEKKQNYIGYSTFLFKKEIVKDLPPPIIDEPENPDDFIKIVRIQTEDGWVYLNETNKG